MRDTARSQSDNGPGRGPAVAVQPRGGAVFRWIVAGLLAVSTLALVAIAGLTALMLQELKSTDIPALKQDIAGVKSETASFHADMGKAMSALQKGLAETASEVNSATLELNDIALSLHKKP